MQKEIDELKNRPVAVAAPTGETPAAPVETIVQQVSSGPSIEELKDLFATKEELAAEASKIVDLEVMQKEIKSHLETIDKH